LQFRANARAVELLERARIAELINRNDTGDALCEPVGGRFAGRFSATVTMTIRSRRAVSYTAAAASIRVIMAIFPFPAIRRGAARRPRRLPIANDDRAAVPNKM